MSTTRQKLEDLRKQEEILTKQLEEEEREEKNKRQLKVRPVAELAHSLFCGYNHTDGCGWGYEENSKDPEITWGGWSHQHWLDKVEKIAKEHREISMEEIHETLKAIQAASKTQEKFMWVVRQLFHW